MRKREESYYGVVFRKLMSHKAAVLGLCLLILEVLLVIMLPPIMKLDPISSDYSAVNAVPDGTHLLGTDAIGRDIFARLVFGGRTSLLVGLLSTLISCALGVPLGILAGYLRGRVETVIMRAADIFMSFPSIVMILVLVSVLGPSVWSVTLVIGVLGWTQFARLIYGSGLSVTQEEYVTPAKAIGTRTMPTILRYVLPNAVAPILIALTLHLAEAILTESSLSFLGLGVQPPQASWGNMLHDAQSLTVLSRRPWIWLPPGIAILTTVLSINFLGDGLRDALDPKQN